MPVYHDNILPAYSDASWDKNNATAVNFTDLLINADGYAEYQFSATNYTATGTMLLSGNGTTGGTAYMVVVYQDEDDNQYYGHTIKIVNEPFSVPIALLEASTTLIRFRVFATNQIILHPVSAQLVEQAISSFDLEYASGTSNVTPPTEGWQTSPPQYDSGKYIWQRTATTFEDGHTEYSAPVCIQNISAAGIQTIIEQQYLSTSDDAPVGGSWSTEQLAWQEGKYLWARSMIIYMDGTTGYTDPVLATSLNAAYEQIQLVDEAIDALDQSLTQEDIFNRLTNNGAAQGMFLDGSDVYFNATYIRTGHLEVSDAHGYVLFSADISDDSVYIAGFTVSSGALTTSTSMSLGSIALGIYIGTNGFTSAGGNRHITMSMGKIYGGSYDGAETGYLHFGVRRTSDNGYGTRLAGETMLVLSTGELGVSDYVASDATNTYSIGGSGQWSSGFVNASSQQYAFPYNLQLVSPGSQYGYISYGAWIWTGFYPRFTKGLLTSVPQ